MCDRVGVLYAGRLVEEGPVDEVFNDPRHPYTVGLLRCLPRGGVRKDQQRLDTIPGFLPQLGADLPACVFVERCGLAQEICSQGGAAVPRPRQRAPQPLPLLGAGARAAARHARLRGVQAGRPERRSGDPRREPAQDVPPGGQRHPRRGRPQLLAAAGRDAGPGGRVRQRQDDARAHAARADPRRRGVDHRARRRRAREADHQARARRRARAADRLPEPRLRAQPPLLRAAHPEPRAGEAARRRAAASARSTCRSSRTRSASTRA